MKNKIVIGLLSVMLIISVVGIVYQINQNNILKESISSSAFELETLENTISETDTAIADANDKNVELEKTISDLQSQIDELQTELEKATENPYNIVPITLVKYTNADADIYSIPDKKGELIDSVAINTQLTKTGETADGSWSRIEHNGMVCFIKSSLLSDSKTEVKKPSKGVATQEQSTPQPSTPSTPSTGGNNSGGGASNGNPDLGSMYGDAPQGGSGGYNGGTTGSDMGDRNYGGGY